MRHVLPKLHEPLAVIIGHHQSLTLLAFLGRRNTGAVNTRGLKGKNLKSVSEVMTQDKKKATLEGAHKGSNFI